MLHPVDGRRSANIQVHCRTGKPLVLMNEGRMHLFNGSAYDAVAYSPVKYCSYSPFSYVPKYAFVQNFWRFGKLYNDTFLETLGPTESGKQCLHFSQAPYGRHFRFSKWQPLYLKSGNISASKHQTHDFAV